MPSLSGAPAPVTLSLELDVACPRCGVRQLLSGDTLDLLQPDEFATVTRDPAGSSRLRYRVRCWTCADWLEADLLVRVVQPRGH